MILVITPKDCTEKTIDFLEKHKNYKYQFIRNQPATGVKQVVFFFKQREDITWEQRRGILPGLDLEAMIGLDDFPFSEKNREAWKTNLDFIPHPIIGSEDMCPTKEISEIEDIKPKPIDEAGFFYSHYLYVIAGETEVLKSTGIFYYLLYQYINLGYFGEEKDFKVKTRFNKIEASNKEPIKATVKYLELDKIVSKKDYFERIKNTVKREKLNCLFLDPPDFPDNLDDSKNKDSRKFIAEMEQIAKETGCCIIVARNFNKSEDIKKEIHKIYGAAAWFQKPRFCAIVYECEIGSKHRKNQEDPKASFLVMRKANEGYPQKTIKFTLEIKGKEAIPKYETLDFPLEPEDRKMGEDKSPVKPDKSKNRQEKIDKAVAFLTKAPQQNIEKQKTREYRILYFLSEKEDGRLAGKLRNWIIKELKVSEGTAKRDMSKLKDENYVKAEGTTPKVTYRITEKGLEILNS